MGPLGYLAWQLRYWEAGDEANTEHNEHGAYGMREQMNDSEVHYYSHPHNIGIPYKTLPMLLEYSQGWRPHNSERWSFPLKISSDDLQFFS